VDGSVVFDVFFPLVMVVGRREVNFCSHRPSRGSYVRLTVLVPNDFIYSLRHLSPHYKLSWFPILSSCLDGIIFITLTESPLMAPRCLGSDDCVHPSINHLHLTSHAIPYGYTDQTTTYLVFLLSVAPLFGLPASLHYFNDPFSWLLHTRNQAALLCVDCFQLLVANQRK